MPSPANSSRWLAWYFVIVWGSAYIAVRIGIQHAAPFTFLTLRFIFGLFCVGAMLLWTKPRWPTSRQEFMHICIAGVLMHAINLSGSHYSQYLGLSAGMAALILATQPLLTAAYSAHAVGERLSRAQLSGVMLGLAGVALVVWHKIELRDITYSSLVAAGIALVAITAGTLYQRNFCGQSDLRSASFIQFGITVITLAPFAWFVEGFKIDWDWRLLGSLAFLVIFGSIFAVNALHTLMRRGQATRVTSLFYLTPIIAVLLEWLLFGTAPSWTSVIGIAVTCVGVALVSWRKPVEPVERC